MSYEILQISAAEWEARFAANAHRAAFNEIQPPGLERIDFACLIVDAALGAVGYATCRETDRESLYLKYGGAFENIAGGIRVVPAYRALISFVYPRYARITTLVDARNTRYLKLALSVGFYPIGMRNFGGRVFLELLKGEE